MLIIPCYFWKKKIVDFDKYSNDRINNATMSDDKVVTSSNPRGPCFHFFCMPLLLPELSYKNNLPRKHMRVSRAMEAKRGLSLLESAPRLLSYSLSTNRWCKKSGSICVLSIVSFYMNMIQGKGSVKRKWELGCSFVNLLIVFIVLIK